MQIFKENKEKKLSCGVNDFGEVFVGDDRCGYSLPDTPENRRRVNLDGEDRDTVYEVKTTGKSAFKLSKAYWMQTQVEMWATHKQCVVITYRLTEEDYRNYFLPIDPARIEEIPVAYDAEWIRDQYLPRVKFLARCLRKGTAPWVETSV